MAIRDPRHLRSDARTVVACVGEAPDDSRAFESRGMSSMQLDPSSMDMNNLDAYCALVFSQSESEPTASLQSFDQIASKFLDADCSVYLRVAGGRLGEAGDRIARNVVETAGLPLSDRGRTGPAYAPFVVLCGDSWRWADIAQMISQNPPGPSRNRSLQPHALRSNHDVSKLKPYELTLLQRAFWNCSDVRLLRMDDGLSDSRTYKAHFELAAGLHGSVWPPVQFVKIGGRELIQTEIHKHLGHVQPYLSAHSHTRLDQQRCGLSARHGIIVGDFVEDAELLRDNASAGRASAAISNLFNKSLRPWHSRADPTPISVADHFGTSFPIAFPLRLATAQSLGLRSSPEEIRALFLECRSQPLYWGPIHNDLHATNVFVRGTDAIVIDMEKFEDGGPTLYDFANLEASFFIDGFLKDPRDVGVILNSVHELYKLGCLLGSKSASCHPADRSTWFFDSVREVRLHARRYEFQSGQYGAILSYALAKKAANDRPFTGEDKRNALRAAALVLAEQVLQELKPSPAFKFK